MIDIQKLYVFNVFSSISLKISIRLLNHHNLGHKRIHHRQKLYLPSLLFFFISGKIYLLSKFLIIQYNIIDCRNRVVQFIYRIYFSCITETLHLWLTPPCFPCSQPLATTILTLLLRVWLLDSSCKWYGVVIVLWCLAYFTLT